jgi:uncharacterized membrane protein (UPF0127 family)
MPIYRQSEYVPAVERLASSGEAFSKPLPRPRVIVFQLKVRVRNQTRNTMLAEAAEVADTSAKRRTGLLKHSRLETGEGLWILPCESVHTFFMKFPIDLVYLDRKRKVRKVRHAVPAWRLSMCLTAHSVLELPAGTAERTGTAVGDELAVEKLG